MMEDIEDMDVEMIMTNKRNDERPNAHAVRCSRTVWAGRALGDSFIPGISIYLLSRSCRLSRLLFQTAIKCSDQREDADVWILNSCTVKTPSEHHLRNMVTSGTEKSKKIIVAGCVPQAQPNIPWLNGVSLLGVHNIDRVVEVLEETAKGNVIHLLTRRTSRSGLSRNVPLLLPKIRRNSLVELLPISSGCLNKCTYCKTKQARGNLVSYSVEEIVARAKTAFQEGVKEIWLTSEDLGAYGRDIDVTLPDLLNDLVAVIPDGCMLRLGMTNPPYILDYLEEIAKILRHPRVYSFLHIPVQSGSDAVLREMRREYSVDDFRAVVHFMQRNVPDISIATDVICGFPTETDEDFSETMKLIDQYKFPTVFINQFYPRPGTKAAAMKLLPTEVVKQRTKMLTALFHSYQPYANRVGRVYKVLVAEKAFRGDFLVAHNKAYEQVLLPNIPTLMGKEVQVRVTSSSKHSMTGEVIESDQWPIMRYVKLLSLAIFQNGKHLFVIFCLAYFYTLLRAYFFTE